MDLKERARLMSKDIADEISHASECEPDDPDEDHRETRDKWNDQLLATFGDVRYDALQWSEGDVPLPEDDEIRGAHPNVSGEHETWGEAMRLVGAKRSKGALVGLVNWLLVERKRLQDQQHADFVRLSKLVFPFDKTHPATDTSAIMMNVELLAECGDCDERAAYRYCEKCAPEEDTVVEAIAKWLETQFIPHGVILRLLDGQWKPAR